MKLTVKQAERLINVARDSISSFFKGKEYTVPAGTNKEFSYERGVFVSLYSGESRKDLMGCIGFPEPMMPLAESVAKAAKGAAFEDPRFPPLKKEQMKGLKIEITVLTEPEVIEVKRPIDYLKSIKIGEDGLMVKDEFGAGVLLPQVPVEWEWSEKEFLENTCRKAGLDPNCWNNMRRNVYRFQAQIFSEKDGKVVEKKLMYTKR